MSRERNSSCTSPNGAFPSLGLREYGFALSPAASKQMICQIYRQTMFNAIRNSGMSQLSPQ